MLPNIKIFENAEFGKVRVTTDENNEAWFNATDVCKGLGYAAARNAVKAHVDCDDALKRCTVDSKGRKNTALFVNESGLYAVSCGSNLENAKAGKRWVTKDVLPSIRKTGNYTVPASTDEQTAQLQKIVKDRHGLKLALNTINTVKDWTEALMLALDKEGNHDYLDYFLRCRTDISMITLANDYGVAYGKMYEYMEHCGVLERVSSQSANTQCFDFVPEFQQNGMFYEGDCISIKDKNGDYVCDCDIMITTKGRIFMYLRLRSIGILPVIERSSIRTQRILKPDAADCLPRLSITKTK